MRVSEQRVVCPVCSVSLAKRPQRRTRCPHCREIIHVRSRQSLFPSGLLSDAQLEELTRHEGDAHVALLNAYRTTELERLCDGGVITLVRVNALGARSCEACRRLDGVIVTVEAALGKPPLPCAECTTTLHNGWPNVCRCTYSAVMHDPRSQRPALSPLNLPGQRLLDLSLAQMRPTGSPHIPRDQLEQVIDQFWPENPEDDPRNDMLPDLLIATGPNRMPRITGRDPIEVYVSDKGYICIKQEGYETETVCIAPDQLPVVLRWLQDALPEAQEIFKDVLTDDEIAEEEERLKPKLAPAPPSP